MTLWVTPLKSFLPGPRPASLEFRHAAFNYSTRGIKVSLGSSSNRTATANDFDDAKIAGTVQQGNEQMPLIVSGLEEVIIATATAQQGSTNNRYIDLMIDCGAATHVCPPWFATESQLQPLTQENGPQLRAVTNQPIKLHGYKWVCMNNINGQRVVIPFYVCDIKQPILSVTRLIEQGFQIVLDDNPRIHHDKGFDSSLTRSHGLLFLQAEITTLPQGTELKVDSTEQGQVAMIAPTTALTPQGAQYTGYAGDYWQFNSQGELVRVHRQYRKTMFTPTRTQRPVSTDRLENYRRTMIKGENGATRTIEDRYQHLDNPNQAQPTLWKGETV